MHVDASMVSELSLSEVDSITLYFVDELDKASHFPELALFETMRSNRNVEADWTWKKETERQTEQVSA